MKRSLTSRILFFTCLLWLSSKTLYSQCSLPGSVSIPVSTDLSISLEISGSNNDDLSSPTQGVCAVLIEFRHPRISQMSIGLRSPSGDEIILVGPIGTGNPTNSTTWNLTFLPCAIPPAPDPTFNSVFNSQSDWGIFGNFNGSYYPNSGCLEDFSTGSINGIWELFIDNTSPFDEGMILNFSIIFCDDSGLDCFFCSADGGQIGISNNTFCENEEGLLLDINRSFTSGLPDPESYEYLYLILSGQQLLDTTRQPDLRQFPPGNYDVCGLSFLIDNQDIIPEPGSALDLSVFQETIQDPSEDICAALSDSCLNIEILGSIDTTFIDTILCFGDSILFDDEFITSSGTYTNTSQGSNGCDSVVVVTANFLNLNANFDSELELDCSSTEVALDANIFQSDFDTLSFHFSDPNGQVIGNILPEFVDSAGIYLLEILGIAGDISCSFSFEYNVIQLTEDYQALIELPDTICISQVLNIDLINPINNTQYDWTISGELQQFLSDPDSSSLVINLIQEGDTEICLQLSNACFIDTVLCEIIHIAGAPIISTNIDPLICDDNIVIEVSGISDIDLQFIDGPQQPTSISPFENGQFVVEVSQSGQYEFGFNTPDGVCAFLETVTVNISLPPDFEFELLDDTLCLDSDLSIFIDNLSLDTLAFSILVNGMDTLLVVEPGSSTYQLPFVPIVDNVLILEEVTISGSEDCVYTIEEEIYFSSIDIEVETIVEVCNNTDTGQPTVIDIDQLIVGEYLEFTVSGPPSINFDNLPLIDFINIEEGPISFQIEVIYHRSCPPLVASLMVNVNDCSCITAELFQSSVSYCISDTVDLFDYLSNPVPGDWSLLEEPAGSVISLENGKFLSSDGTVGLYRFQFVPLQPDNDCPADSVVLELSLIDVFNAGQALLDTLYLCPFGSDEIMLFDHIADFDPGGSWQIISGDPSAFVLNSETGRLINILPTSEDLTLSYSLIGSDECSSQAPILTIKVSAFDYHPPPDSLFLTCLDRLVTLDLSLITPDTSLISWSSRRGREMYDESNASLSFRRQETLFLEIVNADGTCIILDTVHIEDISENINDVDLLITPIPCPDLGSTGSVEILDIFGGTPPFSILFNGKIPQDPSLISNLRQGTYAIEITDSSGCTWESEVEILESDTFFVDIGPDLNVKAGQQVEIDYMSNIEPSDVSSWQWLVNGEPICPSCPTLSLQPLERLGITLELHTIEGCTYTDRMNIFVDLRDLVYIPNAFTPNDDGVNDVFSLMTNDERIEVIQLEVFDRWGGVVFEQSNYFPAQERRPWDGTYRGSLLNPGIYICKVQLKLPNGTIQFLHQEVALIR